MVQSVGPSHHHHHIPPPSSTTTAVAHLATSTQVSGPVPHLSNAHSEARQVRDDNDHTPRRPSNPSSLRQPSTAMSTTTMAAASPCRPPPRYINRQPPPCHINC